MAFPSGDRHHRRNNDTKYRQQDQSGERNSYEHLFVGESATSVILNPRDGAHHQTRRQPVQFQPQRGWRARNSTRTNARSRSSSAVFAAGLSNRISTSNGSAVAPESSATTSKGPACFGFSPLLAIDKNSCGTPHEEIDRRRRLAIQAGGKMGDGEIIDVNGNSLV